MKFKLTHISILTLLLVFGLQIGSQPALYAFSTTTNTTISLDTTTSVNEISSAELHYQISDNQQLFAEIGEEISEEEKKVIKTTASIAVKHAYYSSCLPYLSFSPTSKIQYFDTSSLVSTTPIYLQNEVFRL